MKNMKSRLLKALGMLLPFSILFVVPAAVLAGDTYPSKAIRLIIPFPPGGSNDIIGRPIGNQLSARLGKQVVVDNRGGAGAVLGTEMAAKSEPDGYTLLLISASYTINRWLYKLPYDHEKAFVPIALLGSGPNALSVHPSVPANSVKELIALAKKQPGNLICGAAGAGSFMHLGSELFKMMAGIDFMIVQYKGGGPAMTDQLGGHSHLTLSTLNQSVHLFQAGKLRALGVGGKKRNARLPDVPTISEAGVPGYEASNWWGMLAPTGTPQTVVDRLYKELAAIMNSAEMKKIFEEQGADPDLMEPVKFDKFIDSETDKWGKVIKQANIKVE